MKPRRASPMPRIPGRLPNTTSATVSRGTSESRVVKARLLATWGAARGDHAVSQQDCEIGQLLQGGVARERDSWVAGQASL